MTDNPYRYIGEKLLEPAGPDLWPLAILYFDPKTKGLRAAVANAGAELIIGRGWVIGVTIEEAAKELEKLNKKPAKGVEPSAD